MRINQNISALNAYRHLNVTDSRLNKSMERLSSGLRINRAADDAAGLSISEKMRAQIRGLRMALRNAQDGISLIQTAEGAMAEVHSILQRMRELAVQAANETYTSSDRMEIQKEIEQLKMELNRISSASEFNSKKLLDGTSSAIVSTDRITTHVFMRDGLRYVDQFGQKIEGGGNYKIAVGAVRIGSSQVQKSNIFMAKHGVDGVRDLAISRDAGITDLAAQNLQLGSYGVATVNNRPAAEAQSSAFELQSYLGGVDAPPAFFQGSALTAGISAGATNTAYSGSLLLEVVSANPGADQLVVNISGHLYHGDGSYWNIGNVQKTLTMTGTGATSFTLTAAEIGDGAPQGLTVTAAADLGGFEEGAYVPGDKAVVGISQYIAAADIVDQVRLQYNHAGAGEAVGAFDGSSAVFEYTRANDGWNNGTRTFRFITLDGNGNHYDGSIDLSFGGLGDADPAASFEFASGMGRLATLDTRLYDIREFWDANGRFLLETPQTVTIVQGDGTQSYFTLDMNDTLGSLREKINRAIGEEDVKCLQQGRYVHQEMQDNFVTYVTGSVRRDGTHLSTEGTLVVRSVIPGRQGNLAFFGKSDIINALGFQTIQHSSETIFNITVSNAHNTNELIARDVQISSNLLVGVVHPSVDVEFDPLAGMGMVTELDENGAFRLVSSDVHETYIHLRDNTLIFQIGPNPGQDVGAAIGRMDSRALGLHGILVTDRIKANMAIEAVDRAMVLVSSERSKLGAVQNRLEHTVSSLSVAIENMSASESRIRDLNIAEEMVEFTKNQILLQAGTAMLAQANMKPQAILQLLGG